MRRNLILAKLRLWITAVLARVEQGNLQYSGDRLRGVCVGFYVVIQLEESLRVGQIRI
jgi:hypothetical protein